VFLEINSPLRTNESFRNKVNEEYHKGGSPLELLPINIIDVVCLDYMHNVCIGVTKKLVKFWVKGKKNVRLNETSREQISTDLINLRVYVPTEFSRLPRKIEDIDYWKATELRSFLLYFGPIVLKGKLNRQFYSHFMLLSCAIKILVCPILCQTQINLAEELLRQFVISYSSLYGEHFVSYNVHSLVHLPLYVRIHDASDNYFGCFKYENYLQEIKYSIKGGRYPLQELSNRILEKQKVFLSTPILPFQHLTLKEIENTTSSLYYKLNDTLFKNIILHDLNICINIVKKRTSILSYKMICLFSGVPRGGGLGGVSPPPPHGRGFVYNLFFKKKN
jgi:hypothetical protein